MRIVFTRHGESQANILHEISNRGLRHGLTLKGREQALELARSLAQPTPLRIYSSPILRAIETSVILAQQLGVAYEVTDALREYDCGMMEGRADEAAWLAWQELFDAWIVHHRWEQRIAGGESFYDLRDRFVPFIEGLAVQYGESDASLVCVSHGGVYWMMLPLVLRNVDTGLIARHKLDYTTRIVAELLPAGLICVEWNGIAVSAG